MTKAERARYLEALAAAVRRAKPEHLTRAQRDLAVLRAQQTTDSALLSTMGQMDLEAEIEAIEKARANGPQRNGEYA